MDILHTADIAYVASGFGVGFLVGLTGVGGGSLMTPLLILLFGVHPATAVGTDLFYACATKAGGSGVHAFNRTIDWRIVARLATGSAPAAALTLLVLRSLGVESEKSGLVISKMLGIALVLTALSLIFRQTLLRAVASRTATRQTPADGATRNLTIATGAALGVLVTVSSVGAGALGMTALLALYPRQPLVRLVGSDIAHAVPLTLVAGVGHWAIGDIDFTLLFSLLLGSLPGITIASMLAPLAPERLLRLILAGVLILAAWRLLLG